MAKAKIESLTAKHSCGKTALQAKHEIQRQPGYLDAIVEAILAAEDDFLALDDPNPIIDSVERAVIQPVVSQIKSVSQNHWPLACRP